MHRNKAWYIMIHTVMWTSVCSATEHAMNIVAASRLAYAALSTSALNSCTLALILPFFRHVLRISVNIGLVQPHLVDFHICKHSRVFRLP